MRYAFTLNGRSSSVAREEQAAGPRYIVEGEAFDPKVETLGKGHYRVTVGNQRYEFHVRNGIITEGPRQLDLEVRRDRPQLERSRAGGRRADGRIKPPMPGKVVEVKVKEGQVVKEGDVLLVLEAMKMQNDLKAPAGGIITRVHVQEGANVEASTVLLELQQQAPA